MGFTLNFRDQIGSVWERSRQALLDMLDGLVAQLASLGPLRDNLSTPYPASSVLVTDSGGTPSWNTILPQGVAIGARTTTYTRANGTTVLPTGQNLQTSVALTTSGFGSSLGHSFFTAAPNTFKSGGPQGLESYLFLAQTGTNPLSIGIIGNVEHGSSGTLTALRSVQGGGIITGTGGGTAFECFRAAPSGRAFGGTGTFTNGYGFVCQTFGAGFTNKFFLYCEDTTAGSLLAGGLTLNIDNANKPTSNTWTITSDARAKSDVEPFTDGLNVVDRLRPVSYVLNGRFGTPVGDQGIGLIAQDAKPVAPYIVKSATKDGEAYLTMDSGPLTFVLLNAVRELAARVAALEAARG